MSDTWDHLTRFEQQMALGRAVCCYRERKARRELPEGHCLTYWAPSCNEKQVCCYGLSATDRYPHRLVQHCRTITHVATLHEVPPAVLSHYVRSKRRRDPVTGFYVEMRMAGHDHVEAVRIVTAAIR